MRRWETNGASDGIVAATRLAGPPGRANRVAEDRLLRAIDDLPSCEQQRTYAGGSGGQALDRVRYASHSTREQPMRIETQPQDHPTATAAEIARLLVSVELSQGKGGAAVPPAGCVEAAPFQVPGA